MKKFSRRLALTVGAVPLLLIAMTETAFAASITNGILYEDNGPAQEWTGPGTYDDGVPEMDSADPQGYIMQDAYDDTKMLSSYEIDGTLNNSTLTVTYYDVSTDSSGAVLGSSTIGTATISASQLGTKISVPSGTNALAFTVNATDGPGQVYLHYLWGDPYDLTGTPSSVQGNVSAGEEIFSVPSWWGNDMGSSTPTSSITAPSGATINVYGCPNPPNWDAIEQGIANDIINSIPPVDPPPSDTGSVTASTGISPPALVDPSPVQDVPVTGVPVSPVIGSTSYDFTDSGDTNAIPIPTTDSQPFNINDPMEGLTYSTSIPIPGSTPASSLQPATSGSGTPLPTIAAPSSGANYPIYSGDTSLLGSLVVPTAQSGSTSGPTPAPPSSGSTVDPVPSVSGVPRSAPSIDGTSSSGPSYNYLN